MNADNAWITAKLAEIHDVADARAGSWVDAANHLERVRGLCRDALAYITDVEADVEHDVGWIHARITEIRDLVVATEYLEAVKVCDYLLRSDDGVPTISDRLAERLAALKATVESHGSPEDAAAEIVGLVRRLDAEGNDVSRHVRERLAPTGEDNAEWFIEMALETVALADGEPGDVMEEIRRRGRYLNRCVNDTPALADQLASLPGLREPYGTVGEAADQIVNFITSQPEMRDLGIEHWVLIRLQKRAAERRRATVDETLRRVASEHLYPALRDIGIEDPEDIRIEFHFPGGGK